MSEFDSQASQFHDKVRKQVFRKAPESRFRTAQVQQQSQSKADCAARDRPVDEVLPSFGELTQDIDLRDLPDPRKGPVDVDIGDYTLSMRAPVATVRKAVQRIAVGSTRAFRNGWDRIFGGGKKE